MATQDRGERKQLAARRIQDRLRIIEQILDGDPKKNILPKELTEDQRLEYLSIYQKLAKLLSDGDRIAVQKSKRSAF